MLKEERNWYISIGETAKMLGVHVKTIRRWEKKGIINEDFRTVGGHKRYEYEKIKSLLKEIVKSGKILKNKNLDSGKKEKNENENELKTIERKKQIVIYARVSSSKQKEDLGRQIELLQDCIEEQKEVLVQVYKDIGSGMNDKRKGLQRLIRDCLKKPRRIDKVIITFGDRLTRFGTNIIREILAHEGIELQEMHKREEDSVKSLYDELLKDFMGLLTSFSGKYYRIRRHELQFEKE